MAQPPAAPPRPAPSGGGDGGGGIDKEDERRLRREKALNELVQTEETYSRLLGLLIVHYVIPLRDHTILSEDNYKCLFPQVETIKGLSDKFLSDLKKKRSTWDESSSLLSDLFEEFVPFFRMYQGYVNNYDRAVELMNKIETNKKWSEYMSKVRSDCEGFNLASLLILPVQRIPRYKLLLTEVHRNTKESHPDYKPLKIALAKVEEVSTQINERMKECERREIVRKIERKFTQKINLLKASRIFVKQGKLWKVCRNKDRVYHFFLFSDLLLYASSYGTGYNLHNSLDINLAFNVQWISPDKSKYGDIVGRAFQIISSKKSFVVYSDTELDAKDWFNDIKKHVDKIHEISKMKGSETGDAEAVAVWVPDAHADSCTMPDCHKKFTFMNRRHHCRRCGALACATCTKYKLPNPEGAMQRACKRCYFAVNDEALSKTESGGAFSGVGSTGLMSSASSTLSGDDEESSEDEFQAETNELEKCAYYIDSTDLSDEDIFMKFGRGVGSYCLIAAQQQDKSQYWVKLVVYTTKGPQSWDIGLVNKKKGIEYRLHIKKKKKDFGTLDLVREHLTKKEKVFFSYAIPKAEVMEYQEQQEWTQWGNAGGGVDSGGAGTSHYQDYSGDQGGIGTGVTVSIRGLDKYPRARALFDYDAEVLGDLTMAAGDIVYVIDKGDGQGWWQGVIGDRQGLFPSTYVELIDKEKAIPMGKNEPKQGDLLIARFAYTDGGSEELCFDIGDEIILMDKDDSGWWLGKLSKTGAVGWFAPDLTQSAAEAAAERDQDNDGDADNDDDATTSRATDKPVKPKKKRLSGLAKLWGGGDSGDSKGSSDTQSSSQKSQDTASASASPKKSYKKQTAPIGKTLPPAPATTAKTTAPTTKKSTAPTSNGTTSSSGGGGGGPSYTVSYDDLKTRKFDAAKVDTTKLEAYLSDSEFYNVFEMTRDEYYKSPVWKQRILKKNAGLF